MSRRRKGGEQPDLWDRFRAQAVERQVPVAEAVEKEAKIRRSRNRRSNWTGDRQTLSEIQSLIAERHHGPCDTDDGEAYLRSALPWLASKAGGLASDDLEERIVKWAAAVVPRVPLNAIHDCITDVQDRNACGKLWWSASDLGNLLQLTVAERESLGITRIRPGRMTGRQFTAYRRQRKTAQEKVRRIANGARPREQSKAQLQPWDALGMSRATYFRHQRAGTLPAQIRDRETVSCPASTKYLQPGTGQSHVLEPTVPGPARLARPTPRVGAGGHSPGGKTRAVSAGRAVAMPLPADGVSEHPDLLGGGEWRQVGAPLIDYDGGVLPPELVQAVRDAQRARQITQDALARQIGVSRPQLANALQGRFGLSRTAATNLLVWLAA